MRVFRRFVAVPLLAVSLALVPAKRAEAWVGAVLSLVIPIALYVAYDYWRMSVNGRDVLVPTNPSYQPEYSSGAPPSTVAPVTAVAYGAFIGSLHGYLGGKNAPEVLIANYNYQGWTVFGTYSEFLSAIQASTGIAGIGSCFTTYAARINMTGAPENPSSASSGGWLVVQARWDSGTGSLVSVNGVNCGLSGYGGYLKMPTCPSGYSLQNNQCILTNPQMVQGSSTDPIVPCVWNTAQGKWIPNTTADATAGFAAGHFAISIDGKTCTTKDPATGNRLDLTRNGNTVTAVTTIPDPATNTTQVTTYTGTADGSGRVTFTGSTTQTFPGIGTGQGTTPLNQSVPEEACGQYDPATGACVTVIKDPTAPGDEVARALPEQTEPEAFLNPVKSALESFTTFAFPSHSSSCPALSVDFDAWGVDISSSSTFMCDWVTDNQALLQSLMLLVFSFAAVRVLLSA